MPLFYSPEIKEKELVAGTKHKLPPEEASHAVRVLRLTAGEKVFITDGKGHLIEAVILAVSKRDCIVEFLSVQNNYGKRNYYLRIAVGPTKNIKRFDWFLEKATETGVDEITPVISFHSERREVKIARSNKVITAAVKQSLKAYHPVLNDVTTFNDFVSECKSRQKYIAHYTGPEQLLLKDAVKPEGDVTILIGPEGDFSKEEVNFAIENGFIPVSLGNTRLRTETAALMSVFTVNLINL